jgi:hypothetical protein
VNLPRFGYFRTLGIGKEQSNARYLMTEVLVEHLVERGVRYLLDGGSLALPNGIRHFQRMVGFRVCRIRVARDGRTWVRAFGSGARTPGRCGPRATGQKAECPDLSRYNSSVYR